jgi:hypothetical protein
MLIKLSERTLAIEFLDSERRAVSIPAGAIIRVVSGLSKGDRTVDVVWEGRKVEIFTVELLIARRDPRRRRNPHE